MLLDEVTLIEIIHIFPPNLNIAPNGRENMNKELEFILTLGVSLISAVIAVLALISSQRTSDKNAALEKDLNEKNAALQKDLNAKNATLEKDLNERNAILQKEMDQQKTRIEKRRFITVLWDRMFTLNEVNPEEPIEPDIRHAYNTLESVAMSWDADLVDKELIVVMFGKLYVRLYDQIRDVKLIPGQNISGVTLLQGNLTIEAVYNEIRAELIKRGRGKFL